MKKLWPVQTELKVKLILKVLIVLLELLLLLPYYLITYNSFSLLEDSRMMYLFYYGILVRGKFSRRDLFIIKFIRKYSLCSYGLPN